MIKKLVFLALFAGLVFLLISIFSGGEKSVETGSGYQRQSNNIGQQAVGIENSAQKAASEANKSISEFQNAANGVSQEGESKQ